MQACKLENQVFLHLIVVIQNLGRASTLNPMVEVRDLLLEKALLFGFDSVEQLRLHGHLIVVIVRVVLFQRALPRSQPPVLKVVFAGFLPIRVIAKA